MTTKITFIINNPENPEEFEKAFASIRPAIGTFPALEKFESAKVLPKEDGTPTPAYRTIDLYFANYEDACAAVESATAGEVVGGIMKAGGTFMGLFTEVE